MVVTVFNQVKCYFYLLNVNLRYVLKFNKYLTLSLRIYYLKITGLHGFYHFKNVSKNQLITEKNKFFFQINYFIILIKLFPCIYNKLNV